MRERAAPCLAGLACLATGFAACGSAAAPRVPTNSAPPHAPTAAPRPAPVARATDGIAVRVPRGWHVVRDPLPSLTYPRARMLLTSYRAHGGGRCGPDRAEAALPADGALVFLLEYRPRVGDVWSHRAGAQFSPRPRRWRLGPARSTECWRVSSHAVLFQSASRPFQVQVAFGPHASAARHAEVQRVLRSLRFGTLPPLPADPYAGWRSLDDIEGDTLRTPPGWPVRVTKDRRTVPQPRTLFAAANAPAALPGHLIRDFPPSGVQVRVIEERHGHASLGFPPFPHHAWPAPSDFHAVAPGPKARAAALTSQRSTAEQLGSRFSVWIVSGPDSTVADRARARSAAASVGLSVGAFRNRPRRFTVTQLAYALRTNPNNEASVAACRRLRHPRRHSPLSPPPTFTCLIAVNGNPTATFDVQVLPSGCFVAERRRPGQADYGCIHR